MTKRIALIGASGHGKVVAEVAEMLGYQVELYDDRWPSLVSNGGWNVQGTSADYCALSRPDFDALVAIGDNSIRERIQLTLPHVSAPLIHPQAIVSPSATIGKGSIVMAGVVINAGARIGRGVIVNTGAVVEHDCVIDDFVHISPSAALAGGISVKQRAWVGIGSSIIQQVTIGSDAVIGAGSVVVNDIPDGVTAVGSPCSIIKKKR